MNDSEAAAHKVVPRVSAAVALQLELGQELLQAALCTEPRQHRYFPSSRRRDLGGAPPLTTGRGGGRAAAAGPQPELLARFVPVQVVHLPSCHPFLQFAAAAAHRKADEAVHVALGMRTRDGAEGVGQQQSTIGAALGIPEHQIMGTCVT